MMMKQRMKETVRSASMLFPLSSSNSPILQPASSWPSLTKTLPTNGSEEKDAMATSSPWIYRDAPAAPPPSIRDGSFPGIFAPGNSREYSPKLQ